MSQYTIITDVIGMTDVEISFDYQPSEPATYDYPGCPEEFEPCSFIVTSSEGVKVDCSVMLESDYVMEAVIDAIITYREENK